MSNISNNKWDLNKDIEFSEKNFLYKKGERVENLFYIKNGGIQVIGEATNEKYNVARKFLGLKEVFLNQNYSETAIIESNSKAIVIEKTSFLDLLNKNPKISKFFIKYIVGQLDEVSFSFE